jgi:hypothetical protein
MHSGGNELVAGDPLAFFQLATPAGSDYTRVLLTKLIYPGNIISQDDRVMMNSQTATDCIAFEGDRRVAAGNLGDVARAAKELLDRRKDASILIFDGMTGGPIDIDFRGTVADVLARLPGNEGAAPASAEDAMPSTPRRPGRPKLGVIAREVTLLPRHWEWLGQQPGGASVALRRLVEKARRNGEDRDRVRRAQDATYRFMSAMAGNKPNYEDAIRALFADESTRFEELIAAWPADVRDYTLALAEGAFHREAMASSC